MVSLEVKYPDQLKVIHKNRTSFLYYEMNPAEIDNYKYSTRHPTDDSMEQLPESEESVEATTLSEKAADPKPKPQTFQLLDKIAIECTFRASQPPLVHWSVTRTLGDRSQREESVFAY